MDSIPHPIDWPMQGAWWLAVRIAETIVHINSNVLELGPWWALSYWLLVAILVDLGTWGWEQSTRALRGNDILEVQYANWLGKLTAAILKTVVRGRTWPATAAIYVGWPGAVMLLAVGLLWRWLALAPAIWLAHKALSARQTRIMADRRRLP